MNLEKLKEYSKRNQIHLTHSVRDLTIVLIELFNELNSILGVDKVKNVEILDCIQDVNDILEIVETQCPDNQCVEFIDEPEIIPDLETDEVIVKSIEPVEKTVELIDETDDVVSECETELTFVTDCETEDHNELIKTGNWSIDTNPCIDCNKKKTKMMSEQNYEPSFFDIHCSKCLKKKYEAWKEQKKILNDRKKVFNKNNIVKATSNIKHDKVSELQRLKNIKEQNNTQGDNNEQLKKEIKKTVSKKGNFNLNLVIR